VLVTGSSGQLGSYLLDELEREQVRGVDIRPPTRKAHLPMTTVTDIREDQVFDLCSGMDAVVHLAAQVSVVRSLENPHLDAEINIGGTLSLLRAAAQANVPLFIYVSTAAVYGDPLRLPVDEGHPTRPKSFYGASKLSGEFYTHAFGKSSGLRYIILRPFNMYSPRADPSNPYSGVITRFVRLAKGGRPLTIEGDGGQTRDFIHARDVARMIALCLRSDLGAEILNCASGQGTSVNELAETVASLCPGVRREYLPAREGDIRYSVGDISKARDLLGFSPRISFKEGMREFFTE